jgi:hypothetical protein
VAQLGPHPRGERGGVAEARDGLLGRAAGLRGVREVRPDVVEHRITLLGVVVFSVIAIPPAGR